jgi:hypothetical protein
MMDGLTVGRIVHFIDLDGTHCAALITALGNDVALGQCELLVAIPKFGWRDIPSVYYNPHQKQPGTWHFIEV